MFNSRRIEHLEYEFAQIHKKLENAMAIQEHTSGKVSVMDSLIFKLEDKIKQFEDKYNDFVFRCNKLEDTLKYYENLIGEFYHNKNNVLEIITYMQKQIADQRQHLEAITDAFSKVKPCETKTPQKRGRKKCSSTDTVKDVTVCCDK